MATGELQRLTGAKISFPPWTAHHLATATSLETSTVAANDAAAAAAAAADDDDDNNNNRHINSIMAGELPLSPEDLSSDVNL